MRKRTPGRLVAAALAVLAAAPGEALARKSRAGRPEALIAATAFGFYEGIALSIILDEHGLLGSGKALVPGTALTLTTTVGSFLLADHITDEYGVNEAQGSLVTSTLFWAVLNGAMIGVEAETDTETFLWSTLVSGWTGQAMGILLAANLDRTAGQVSLMNTVATWSGAEAALVLGVAGVERGPTYLTVATVVADVGLLTGAWLVRRVDISQGRARLLDLGALAGGLAGPAALFMVWGPEENLREWYLSAVAVGIPIGVAWHLTRDLDDDPEPERAAEPVTLMLPLAAGRF